MILEPVQILLRISKILEDLEIPYLNRGSVASSIYGIPRATQDIDLVIDISPAQLDDFVRAMKPDFYIDSDMVLQAVRRRASFNAIHFETALKIDFFVCGQGDYSGEEMRRRQEITIEEASGRKSFVASPEDVILQKLVWYEAGARISERQWNDVLGVIKVQGDRLARKYLARWARSLDAEDLLEEAFCDDR